MSIPSISSTASNSIDRSAQAFKWPEALKNCDNKFVANILAVEKLAVQNDLSEADEVAIDRCLNEKNFSGLDQGQWSDDVAEFVGYSLSGEEQAYMDAVLLRAGGCWEIFARRVREDFVCKSMGESSDGELAGILAKASPEESRLISEALLLRPEQEAGAKTLYDQQRLLENVLRLKCLDAASSGICMAKLIGLINEINDLRGNFTIAELKESISPEEFKDIRIYEGNTACESAWKGNTTLKEVHAKNTSDAMRLKIQWSTRLTHSDQVFKFLAEVHRLDSLTHPEQAKIEAFLRNPSSSLSAKEDRVDEIINRCRFTVQEAFYVNTLLPVEGAFNWKTFSEQVAEDYLFNSSVDRKRELVDMQYSASFEDAVAIRAALIMKPAGTGDELSEQLALMEHVLDLKCLEAMPHCRQKLMELRDAIAAPRRGLPIVALQDHLSPKEKMLIDAYQFNHQGKLPSDWKSGTSLDAVVADIKKISDSLMGINGMRVFSAMESLDASFIQDMHRMMTVLRKAGDHSIPYRRKMEWMIAEGEYLRMGFRSMFQKYVSTDKQRDEKGKIYKAFLGFVRFLTEDFDSVRRKAVAKVFDTAQKEGLFNWSRSDSSEFKQFKKSYRQIYDLQHKPLEAALKRGEHPQVEVK